MNIPTDFTSLQLTTPLALDEDNNLQKSVLSKYKKVQKVQLNLLFKSIWK